MPMTLAVALVGCVSEAKRAEEQFNIAQRAGTLGDACRTARAVAEAYLRAQNEQQYRYWNAIAGTYCDAARRDGAEMPADLDQRRNLQRRAADAYSSPGTLGENFSDAMLESMEENLSSGR